MLELLEQDGAVKQEFAQRLRDLRCSRGWTLDEAARRANMSKSYLSRLEEAARQPSIASLLGLARAYGIPVGDILDGGRRTSPGRVVVRAGELPVRQGNGLYYQMLSSSPQMSGLQPVRVTVPADRSGDELYEHDGEEWLHVLSGTLELVLSDNTYVLVRGDSAHFDARIPHRLRALDGTDAELILVACSAPRPMLDTYL
ncbi:MAG: helix-turn-helix domain-containing protein [Capsulimonadaceae bacterium]